MNRIKDYEKKVQKLQKKYIHLLDEKITEITSKIAISQFDDRYMDPFIKCILPAYKNEMDILTEQIREELLEEKHGIREQVLALSLLIQELEESNQEIEAFFRAHGYPYSPYQKVSLASLDDMGSDFQSASDQLADPTRT